MEYKGQDPKVKVIMLLVTNSCNLNCIYCYENHKSNHYMSLDVAKEAILSEISNDKFDVFSIQFMGGEPLMNYSLMKKVSEWIWNEHIITKPHEIFAATNGTCLNDEMKKWFTANRLRISMGLSIDGIPLVQNINRSNSNKTIDIDYFLKTWPNSYFKMTISTSSLSYVYDSIVYLEKKGVKNIKADLAYMQGWTPHHLEIWEEQLDKLCNYYAVDGHKCHCSLFDFKIETIFAKNVKPKRCGCGQDIVCIDYDGKKYPCQMFAPISMDTETWEKVYDVDFDDEKKFEIEECSKCILHPLCPACSGCNLKFNGAVNKLDPFYCKAFIINFMKSLEYKTLMAEKIEDEKLREDTLNDLHEIAKAIIFEQ